MAEALLCKPNTFSPLCFANNTNHHHHHQGLSLFRNQSFATAFPSLKLLLPTATAPLKSHFHGSAVVFGGPIPNPTPTQRIPHSSFSNTQMSIGIGKTQRWWEKGLQPNMKEVKGAKDLVDSLLNAGDKLVVVDFFSPGCGGCKALHPKICQLAEMNPVVQFLQVNYEEHKSMCYSLNVHVLPFFRFYRGAHGRLCSFSCTNATIKKFRDALSKYGADFCSLEPTKGLEEKELLALAANRDLSFNYIPKPESPVVAPEKEETLTEEVVASTRANSKCSLPLPLQLPLPSTTVLNTEQDPVKRTLIPSGR